MSAKCKCVNNLALTTGTCCHEVAHRSCKEGLRNTLTAAFGDRGAKFCISLTDLHVLVTSSYIIPHHPN